MEHNIILVLDSVTKSIKQGLPIIKCTFLLSLSSLINKLGNCYSLCSVCLLECGHQLHLFPPWPQTLPLLALCSQVVVEWEVLWPLPVSSSVGWPPQSYSCHDIFDKFYICPHQGGCFYRRIWSIF